MPDEPTRKAKQATGRAAKGFVQITFRVREDLRRRFKSTAVLEGRDMSDIVEELLEEYLKRRE